MPRTRKADEYAQARHNLIEIGEKLFRERSYASVGINEILKIAEVPKGSFYHYFSGKEAFLVAVAEYYHANQMASAKQLLRDPAAPPKQRLQRFFDAALSDMRTRKFGQGCLMSNLTAELADENELLQKTLSGHWSELSQEVARCLSEIDMNDFALGHLSTQEAGDFLINSWSGGLTRMKATGDEKPLTTFLKTLFERE